MPLPPAVGIAGVLIVLGAMFGLLKLLEWLVRPHPEILRKLLHVGTGLVVIGLPWVFADRWPVLLLAGLSAAALLCVKRVPRLRDGVGTVVTAVGRPTFGEVCFPVAVASLILLSRGDRLLFAVPMLILTLADAVAALVGIAYGRVLYVTSDGLKSAEGSIAFFAIAFLSVHVPLLLFTDVGRAETLLIALIIGLLSTLLEAISARGLDNLLIPLGAHAFLRLYLHAAPDALILRLVVTVSLVIFALAWRRRASMDDGALLAAALYAYGAWMLGGWPWAVGPTVLFLVHVALWPREAGRPADTVWVLLSIITPGLFWLAVQTAYPGRAWLVPYAVAFAAHLTIIGVSRIAPGGPRRTRLYRLAAAAAAGWLLAVLQIAPLLIGRARPVPPPALWPLLTLAALCMAAAAVVFHLLMPRLYGPKGSRAAVHSAGFALAMGASVVIAVSQWSALASLAGSSDSSPHAALR